MLDLNLSPRTGAHLVAGVRLDLNTFLGRVETALLFKLASDPRAMVPDDDPFGERLNTDVVDSDLLEIQESATRVFKGRKEGNVSDYAHYLVKVQVGGGPGPLDGAIPPIFLWCSEQLTVEMLADELGYLRIPYSTPLVAIDGQTQLAARYYARKRLTRELDNKPATVIFCHGRPIPWAKQAMFDLNTKAVPPDAAAALSLDQRDPLVKMARKLETEVPVFKGRVDDRSRQVSSKDRAMISLSALRMACLTFVEGISCVRNSPDKVVFLTEKRFTEVADAAIIWFTAITERYRMAFESKNSLITSSTALAALGGIGHDLSKVDPEDNLQSWAQTLANLGDINWAKGKHWDGIAGKLNSDGSFVMGGPREYSKLVWGALTRKSAKDFERISQRPAMDPDKDPL